MAVEILYQLAVKWPSVKGQVVNSRGVETLMILLTTTLWVARGFVFAMAAQLNESECNQCGAKIECSSLIKIFSQ